MNNDILQKHLDTIIESSSKVRKFIDGVVDAGSFVETDVFMSGATFLDGVEAKGEGVVTGYATLNGSPVQLFAQNTEVLKGSLSVAQAQKIVKTINKAIKTGTPLLSLIDSCGARIGEGVSVLEGYGAVLAAAVELANQVTHICVINGVCVGMMATFAAMADFVFMNKESVLSLNSPMVIASTQKDYPKFNDILGYKSYSANSNMAQFEFKDAKDLKAKITDLFSIINVSEEESSDDPNREAPSLDKAISLDGVLNAICDDTKFIEYSANYAKDIKCGFAKINNISVAVLANNSTENEGFTSLEGLNKATDFVEVANAMSLPIVSLVDSKGVKSCLSCEIKGIAKASAKLVGAIASADVSKIAVCIGKAIGSAYTMFMSKAIGFDYTLACVNAEISPINSDTAVNIVYTEELKKAKDSVKARAELSKKYAELQANAFISAKDGYIDNIVNASALRPYIASALLMLMGI